MTWSACRWPSVSTARWIFEPFLRFPPSYPARLPLFGVDRSVRLSMIVALSSASPPRRQPQHRAQIMNHRFEASRSEAALRLLVHRRPRRQVVGHPPPWRTRLNDISKAVEHLAQVMLLEYWMDQPRFQVKVYSILQANLFKL